MPTTEIERGWTVIEDFDPIVRRAINLIGNWIPIVRITGLAAIVRCHKLVNDNLTDFECYLFVKNRRLGLEKSQTEGTAKDQNRVVFFMGNGGVTFLCSYRLRLIARN
jgi:hypothetical protein